MPTSPRSTIHLPIDWPRIDWLRWTMLVLVAVAGSLLYGASLSAVLADWNAVASALWLALSAGLAWCVFIPALAWAVKLRLVPCVDACLVTMAVGEIILTCGAVVNVLLWWSGVVADAAMINALIVAVSNVVMVTALARLLRPRGVAAARVVAVWMLALNGSGAVFFIGLYCWLHGV